VQDIIDVSDEEMLDICGLDAVIFVRFLRMSFGIMGVNFILGLMVLVPLYSDHDEGATGVNVYSLANVPKGSWDLWASLLFAYIFAGYSCFALYREFEHTVQMRHLFLTKESPHQFSVLVENIPEELRTSVDLQAKFEEFHPGTVKQAYVLMDTKELAATVKEARAVAEKLHEAKKRQAASSSSSGAVETHMEGSRWARCWRLGIQVPPVTVLEDRLIELNEKIGHLQEQLLHQKSVMEKEALQNSRASEHSNTGGGIRSPKDNTTLSAAESVGNTVLDIGGQTVELVSGILTKRNGMGSTGFVTFKFLTAATIAQQTHYSLRPMELTVRAAPSPRDVLWENMSIPTSERMFRKFIKYILFGFLLVGWGIPVAFIGALTSITSVTESETWSGLSKVIGQYEFTDNLITLQLPAILLFVYMQALHPIINALAREAGEQAYSWLQLSVAPTYFAFMVFNKLFVIGLTGTVVDGISDLLEDPLSIVSILGASIPSLGAFYITYILTLALLGLVLRAFMVHSTIFAPSWDVFSDFIGGVDVDIGRKNTIDFGRELPIQLTVFVLCVVYVVFVFRTCLASPLRFRLCSLSCLTPVTAQFRRSSLLRERSTLDWRTLSLNTSSCTC
jgi:hypothetical protein